MCFRIVQQLGHRVTEKIDDEIIIKRKAIDEINDEYLDIDEHTVGYVEDEFFAQEFCNMHSDCYYHPVHLSKYPLQLETNYITEDTELETVTVPIIKPEY